MSADRTEERFVATYERGKAELKCSRTFAQAGMECCGYVKKLGKCIRIELVRSYN